MARFDCMLRDGNVRAAALASLNLEKVYVQLEGGTNRPLSIQFVLNWN